MLRVYRRRSAMNTHAHRDEYDLARITRRRAASHQARFAAVDHEVLTGYRCDDSQTAAIPLPVGYRLNIAHG